RRQNARTGRPRAAARWLTLAVSAGGRVKTAPTLTDDAETRGQPGSGLHLRRHNGDYSNPKPRLVDWNAVPGGMLNLRDMRRYKWRERAHRKRAGRLSQCPRRFQYR